MNHQLKIILAVICLCNLSFAQELPKTETVDGFEKKVLEINKVAKAPKIDGVLNDVAWQNATIATNFTERRPENGAKVPDSIRTEVKVVYTDRGVYFGAKMYDPDPESIPRELTERDNIGNTDFFFVILNGYNDGQQALYFIVTASGVQYDALATNNNEDSSYNGIWDSAVKITDDGWVAEMMIPYRELRFPDKEVQQWDVQFEREYRKDRKRLCWNFVDNSRGSFLQQTGILRGIKDIDPPVRLNFFPFLGYEYATIGGENEGTIFGGMDVKYGINDAFTLDVTLIPDFGQIAFDNVVLNLGPFEQQFNERRPFFTEGTELFSKGNLFFSRRIGGSPTQGFSLADNEIVDDNPGEIDLINAVKVSGRTNKGLGIGILNAVTKKTVVTIKDTISSTRREAVIEPLANYNILVLDQRLKNNSSISLVNTNVLRSGSGRDANVTGLYGSFNNEDNTYNIWGNLEASWVMTDETMFGNEIRAGVSDIAGKHRTQFSTQLRTKDYNIDDLGFTGRNNFHEYYGYYGYRYLQPKGNLNNMFLNFNLNFRRRLQPDLFRELNFNFNSSFTTKNFFSFGGGYETNFGGLNDIYEPRTENAYLSIPGFQDVWIWFDTDFRKKYALGFNADWYKYNEGGRYDLYLNMFNRYRFSDKFTISMNTNFSMFGNQRGFADRQDGLPIIGNRDRWDLTNRFESQYSINDRMICSLVFRHSYSNVEYSEYSNLLPNGDLILANDYTGNRDTTFNTWNIDLRYSWWINRGSQLTLLYRNSTSNFENEANLSFFTENFNRLFDQPMLHQFSVRLDYFIDYNDVKRLFKGKKQESLQTAPIRDSNTGKMAQIY
ncbi:DUF5916 domain-containing protein [Psychroserpens sp.]|uniref:DUF5916 domain-containing protein n=1 Tax=Psychroserpens sp. TaxID=2020870 RepID=UPI001B0832F1|nr:DUF5916 domain-containing protein [Psychroserpens sp.]MBO6606698.1 carbohydrate binding family 9 domain-containing protein [Psychroserpens sp.]MBO6653402.1 carbohydrate binding family 9 domain-containing protein [Psychroserpens sp.]MBO6680571.1 carbohydrate binding family 9 domain-containing protein [Psychroserpens sp.]MBO6750471.1 carbohydrate binding family 9 domain-containing protein [Psychroserpens sp.]MBO6914953.1 carbohydrate binding family 9 domain-containing protein [Psychroserpens 